MFVCLWSELREAEQQRCISKEQKVAQLPRKFSGEKMGFCIGYVCNMGVIAGLCTLPNWVAP